MSRVFIPRADNARDVAKAQLRSYARTALKRKARFWDRLAVAALVVGAGSAEAADLPNLKEAPATQVVSAPTFSWTGFYIGVNGGYGLDHFAFPYFVDLPGGGASGSGGIDSAGGLFGGQIGFNYQLSNLPVIGHAVVGVEADEQWSDISGSTYITNGSVAGTIGTRFENFGTLRARIGYNFDRLLVYWTGGLTYGVTESYYDMAAFSGSRTETYAGLPFRVDVVGLGAEYALTNNFSVKAEYLYDCIIAHTESFSLPEGSINFNSRTMYHIARVGLNYKFDWLSPSTPVTAKY